MRVTIWDLDWYNKVSFIPNVKCMKISSYHKQLGDEINFVTDEYGAKILFDRMYIVCDKKGLKLPPRKLLDDNRVVLIGAGFAAYSKCKELGITVMACRPDYLLYETEERDKFANANFVTFYAGNQLITTMQDYHNTKRHKHHTIVMDKWFWKAKDEEIIYCLEELKNDRNLMFFEPISIKRIISNSTIRQKFLDLHFATGTPFKWKNDYSSDDVSEIIQFLLELREKTRSDLGMIPIRAKTGLENDELELLRCFEIIHQFKCAKLKCTIINTKSASPLFEALEVWTRYSYRLSFVEFVLHNYCLQSGVLWYNILNNSIHWSTAKIDYLLYLLTSTAWSAQRHLLFHQWGNDELNSHLVDYNYIKQHMNLLYKEDETHE